LPFGQDQVDRCAAARRYLAQDLFQVTVTGQFPGSGSQYMRLASSLMINRGGGQYAGRQIEPCERMGSRALAKQIQVLFPFLDVAGSPGAAPTVSDTAMIDCITKIRSKA